MINVYKFCNSTVIYTVNLRQMLLVVIDLVIIALRENNSATSSVSLLVLDRFLEKKIRFPSHAGSGSGI